MNTLKIKVKPNARTNQLIAKPDGTWLAEIKAAPVDGKANAALIALIAEHFNVRRAHVNIRSGASGRMKLVKIDD